jgi:hypothetical protein
VRDTTPLDLRYEWAARRYCLKHQYKLMSSEIYTSERIRKSVTAILDQTGLRHQRK